MSVLAATLAINLAALTRTANAEHVSSVWDFGPAELKLAYPTAISPGKNPRFVQVKDVVIAGLHWDRVDFHFDQQQLVSLKLWTHARTYEQLEAELLNRNSPLWAIGSGGAGRAPARRVMICDYGASVALLFEQPATALPGGILAQQPPPTRSGLSR